VRTQAARLLGFLIGSAGVNVNGSAGAPATLLKAGGLAPLLLMLEWIPPAAAPATAPLADATGGKEAVAASPPVLPPAPPAPVEAAQQAAAAVLVELARQHDASVLAALCQPSCLSHVVAMLGTERAALSHRHAAALLGALASTDEPQRRALLTTGAVPPLVSLLSRSADAQGGALAALSALALSTAARRVLLQSNCADPLVTALVTLAYGRVGWLRAQAAALLELLGHVDPPARAPGTAWRAWAAAAAEAERSAVVGERSAVVGERSAVVGERSAAGGGSVRAAADAAWDQGAIAPSAPEAAAAVSLNHLAISNRITRVVLGSASKLKGVAMVAVNVNATLFGPLPPPQPTGVTDAPTPSANAHHDAHPPSPGGLGAPIKMPPHVPVGLGVRPTGSPTSKAAGSPPSSPLMKFHTATTAATFPA
jgi:hypothetical protein